MILQMGLLIVVLAITILFGLTYKSENEKKHCIQAVTVVLTCFAGFRSWWYGDLIKYYTLYINCNSNGWTNTVFGEIQNSGIRIFFRLAGFLGISYDVCIFIIAAFAAITLGVIVYKYSSSPYYSYLMYIGMGFFIFTYSGLKQTVAMGFICLAYDALMSEKPIKFYIMVALAGLFHAPAMIFIVAYLITRRKINATYFMIIVGFLAVVFLFRDRIVSIMSDIYYEDEAKFTASKLLGGRFIMMAFILIMSLFLRPPGANEEKEYNFTFTLMVISLALQMFSVYNNVFTRLADYYFQFSVIFIPKMLETGESQRASHPERISIRYNSRQVYQLLLIGITVFALWYYRSYALSVGNFKFFWEINAHELYGK